MVITFQIIFQPCIHDPFILRLYMCGFVRKTKLGICLERTDLILDNRIVNCNNLEEQSSKYGRRCKQMLQKKSEISVKNKNYVKDKYQV